MTVAVSFPAPNNTPLWRLGQGLAIIGTISGPTALDDYIDAYLNHAFDGQVVAMGLYVLGGGTSFTCFFDDPGVGISGAALGATLTLTVNGRHANGTVFDTVSYAAGYLYDPITGLGSLIKRKVTDYVTLPNT